MPALSISIVHLYPDLMNVYGDRGNVLALARRCQWRGIEAQVQAVTVGDRLDPKRCDLLFFGGGQDSEQAVVAPDFLAKGDALKQAVEAGAAMLAVCGGYQLLGKFFRTHTGAELPGIGLLDASTVAGPRRHIGNVVARCQLDEVPRTLVGFENHSGRTYLGPGCAPLGLVEVGSGNNGQDGTEGAVYRNVYACYLHGSLLPKNPWLADRLILAAVRRRYPDLSELPALDDALEEQAHAAAAERARQLRKQRSGAW